MDNDKQEDVIRCASPEMVDLSNPSILDRNKHGESSINSITSISLDSFIANLRKARKQSNKNVWHFPLAKFSRDELLRQMVGFQNIAEVQRELRKIPLGFVEAICSVFHYHWKNRMLTKIALETVISVARIGTKEVKIELQQSKVILAVFVSACHQTQDLLSYNSEVDNIMGNLILLCFLEYSTCNGGICIPPDHPIIEATLALVSQILTMGHRGTEKVIQILSWLLQTINSNFDKNSMNVVYEWFSNHGITSLVFNYIQNFSLDKSASFFREALYFVFQIIEWTEINNVYSIIPKLLEFLNSKGKAPGICSQGAEFFETLPMITQILNYVVKNIDGARILLMDSESVLNSFLDAILNTKHHKDILDRLIEIQSQSIQLVVHSVMDKSGKSSKCKEKCKSMLEYICFKTYPLIKDPLPIKHESTIYFSYIFYSCASLLHRHFEVGNNYQEDITLVGMIKALAFLYGIEYTVDGFGLVWRLTLTRTVCVKDFVLFSDSVVYNEVQDSRKRKQLERIVKNNLPDIIEDFIYLQEDISVDFAEAITRIVLLFFDTLEDFPTGRWSGVFFLLLTFHTDVAVNRRNEKKMYTSKLLLMWRLCSMDRSESFVNAIMHLEIDLRESNLSSDEMLKKYTARLIDDTKIKVDDEIVDKYFAYLVQDLKSVLNNNKLIDGGIHGSTDHELRWITYIMAMLAKEFKSRSNVMLLKQLVFSALDFIADRNDQQIKKDVDDFIIHLYM